MAYRQKEYNYNDKLTKDQNLLMDKLYKMRMSGMAEAFENQLMNPNSGLESFETRFSEIINHEWSGRENKKFNRLLKQATLKYPAADLDSSLYDPERQLNTHVIELLAKGDWIDEPNNLLITGGAGAGKTHIACALCVTALHQMRTVKYIRATVSRLNYLLSDETERHGMLILLLNKLGSAETESEQSEMLKEVAEHMNLSSFDVLSDNPLYKRRRRRKFEDDLQEEEEPAELSREDVLRLNKIEHRYTAKQIEEFIDEQMTDGILETDRMDISDDESFEKLILAYDISMRKNSRYRVQVEEKQVSNGNYCYPKMTFSVKQKSIESERN